MYQHIVEGQELFKVSAQGYGQPITTFASTDSGETPMSLLNIALASCLTMCVQGYFAKQSSREIPPVTVHSNYDDGIFTVSFTLGYPIPEKERQELIDYVNSKCRVKAMLREDLCYRFSFVE